MARMQWYFSLCLYIILELTGSSAEPSVLLVSRSVMYHIWKFSEYKCNGVRECGNKSVEDQHYPFLLCYTKRIASGRSVRACLYTEDPLEKNQ